MKKLAFTLSLVFMAGMALAEARLATAAVAADEKGTEVKAETMEVEVVSADAANKTLTIKQDTGDNRTLSVDGKALTTLKTVKAGDRVTVKVRNNAVTEIKTKAPTY